jgi:hypothetical protein
MSDWLARMSGPLTVPFTIAAFLLPSTSARILLAILAVVAALVTCYRVWVKEYDRAEAERAKNEVAPHMDINVLNVVPHGGLGAGLTDLFLNVRSVLGEPSHVSIRDFALEIFDQAKSLGFTSTDDVSEWELVRPVGTYSRFPCVPLVKELTRRGDPIQGWIHFRLPNLSESAVGKSALTLKVNCVHGTCYVQLSGAHVHPDADAKGVMRKVQK